MNAEPFSSPLSDEISGMLRTFAPSIDEFKLAILSKFAPPNPAVTRSNWKRLKQFGNDAPSTEILRKVLEDADYRCQECSGSLRINIDHIDNDNKNHNGGNLQVLCTKCNVRKANDGIKNEDAQYVIYKEFRVLSSSLGRIPETRELAAHIKAKYEFANRPLSGYLHVYRFLSFRYENPVILVDDDVEEFTFFINQLKLVFGISEDELLRAIVSVCTPSDEYSKVSTWKSDEYYGYSAPEASTIRNLFQASGYKCTMCSNTTSFTVDHIDSDPQNHSPNNLQILCLHCNRDKSSKPVKIRFFKARIFDLMSRNALEHNKILTRREVIDGIQDCDQLGGEIHFRHFLADRFSKFIEN